MCFECLSHGDIAERMTSAQCSGHLGQFHNAGPIFQ